MTDPAPAPPKGWRGSRELWLDAARAALLSDGIEAVKIQPLAARLSLSRTSFYWFFTDRAALLDALLEDWEARNTGALLEGCAAYGATIAEAVLNLIAVFLDETRFEPRFDMAVRGWAHRSDAVAARVAEADARRLEAIREMFVRHGFEPAEADVRARTIYLVQVGYIALQTRESLEERLARIPAYVKTFAGQPATEAELARFRAVQRAQ
ncbi:putative transcriptional regulator TetR family protein [Oceanicola granulosus HTCC2516]|uniref:Putative transcriptional regulator TetR family protein n=1 Tax=Oceanicola granulosus (strain ATCC BAA-861 / DSM 15982 / KCTC 12143 / HTCC2516) TaxID=314256 RepID=Q2CA27_OCEGH|nr:TetR/AcrR family transcriptional regulator [Oceanicola granulosus]EAR49538.1 putative transcriptional regulator TetR family protein [Oceanicola granulosus HTCC2516]